MRVAILLEAVTGTFETDMQRSARVADKAAKDVQRTWSIAGAGMRRIIGGLFAGFSVAKIVDETSRAQFSLAQLDAALRSTEEAAGLNRKQLESMARDLTRVTTHSFNEIIAGQTRLLSYSSILANEYPRALQIAIDQSVRLGMSIEQSAEIIGRALELPSRGVASLTQQGFAFSEEQRRILRSLENSGRVAEAQAIVMDVLEESYSGAALAARNTLGGALQSLRSSIGQLLAGPNGFPELTSQVNELSDAFSTISEQESRGWIEGILDRLGASAVGAFRMFSFEIPVELGLIQLNEIQAIERQIEQLQINLGRSRLNRSFSTIFSSNEQILKQIEELEQRRDELVRELEEMIASSGFVPPPSEEFLKISAALEQQIALYGKSGQAAQISYQIQSGALDALSKDEQAQVLLLAMHYDEMVRAAEASKKLTEEREKARETVDGMIATLQQQIGTYGMGEAAAVSWRIAEGDLADTFRALGPEMESRIQLVVDLTEEYERLRKATEDQTRLEQEAARVIESTRNELERYTAQIGLLDQLRNTYVNGEPLIDEETYQRAYDAAKEAYDQAVKNVDNLTRHLESSVQRAASQIQSVLADSIFNKFDEGLKGMVRGFADALRRMFADAAAAQIMEALFSRWGGLGGLLKAILPGFAGGTRFAPGGLAWVGERGPEIVNLPRGAQVFTAQQSARMAATSAGGQLRVIIEEGPSFASRVRTESRDAAVQVVRAASPQIVRQSVVANRTVAAEIKQP